ncbi:uncharacterized protein LOC114292323 [Camellia sinensis]|uniref:uncharacterized protein LOC114292323 n=1 Tax=Camellia sinensis TaxID=4442 RepID=UPI001035757F|nr:uncharacterized protein LOC114292323 [Camellia sinensis]
MPPVSGKPLKLYISAYDLLIGCLLPQEHEMGHEQAIYYWSRRLNDAKTRYTAVEKLCLALHFAAIKLKHHMLPSEVFVVAQTDEAIKGQALADFLAKHPCLPIEPDLFEVHMVDIEPWRLMFDGSRTDEGVGAGIVLIAPNQQMHQFVYQLDEQHVQSCNQAEYEALIIRLELAVEFKIRRLQVFGDSQLVIKQMEGEFNV